MHPGTIALLVLGQVLMAQANASAQSFEEAQKQGCAEGSAPCFRVIPVGRLFVPTEFCVTSVIKFFDITRMLLLSKIEKLPNNSASMHAERRYHSHLEILLVKIYCLLYHKISLKFLFL